MSDTIKCACQNCGAKYRLPIESQGRKARCKKCGEVFNVPRLQPQNMEESILDWLSEPESQDEVVAPPKVISMPAAQADPEVAKRVRGMIRLKDGHVEAT